MCITSAPKRGLRRSGRRPVAASQGLPNHLTSLPMPVSPTPCRHHLRQALINISLRAPAPGVIINTPPATQELLHFVAADAAGETAPPKAQPLLPRFRESLMARDTERCFSQAASVASSKTYPYPRGLAGPEIDDFGDLNGPVLPQNPLKKVGG